MPGPDPAAYVDHIERDGTVLAACARRGLDAAVPGCPDWDVAQLLGHLGFIHHRVAHLVRSLAPGPPQTPDPAWQPPEDRAALLPWFEEGVAGIVDALRSADPDAAVWNWATAAPAPAVFWFRRMAHELTVHRADGEQAHGITPAVDPLLGVDGIDEMFEVFLPRVHQFVPGADIGGTVHLHATDAEGEWLVRLTANAVEVRREHAKGDVAARGSAGDLLLFLWGRAQPASLETHGDAGVLQRWQEIVRI